MAHAFELSSFGMKLIKAYEGFRSVETTLVSGQRVIGYGHRYSADEESVTTRERAEEILKADLAPYEALINENVFAPLTQSQFDALVSLSFNIGPREFLSSNVLHCLNNGRPLEAAAGFDEWRKSVIDGKTYVVDALVRRRTAEKAMFLRPTEGAIAAPRHELPPKSDQNYAKIDSEFPTFGQEQASGLVKQAPYAQQEVLQHKRRREDGPAGILTLSEIDILTEQEIRPAQQMKTQNSRKPKIIHDASGENLGKKLSPIALAAMEVSERLDRLIANDETNPQKSMPLTSKSKPQRAQPSPIAANEGSHKEFRRAEKNHKAKPKGPGAYIQNGTPSTQIQKSKPAARFQSPKSATPYLTSVVVGTTLLVGGGMKWLLSPKGSLDQISAFLAPLSTVIGAMIVLASLYYLAKTLSSK